jgi:hypothetical protein
MFPFYWGPLYGPLHQFGNLNIFVTTFSDAPWKFHNVYTFILHTHLNALGVHKTCGAHGNKGTKKF